MNTSATNIFDLAEQRLGWIDRRQGVLAQNIANANTPGYVAKDLEPFAQVLSRAHPGLAQTNASHITPSRPSGGPDAGVRPTDRAPDGNAVSMDEQLTKIADTDGAQALVTNLYHKYLGLFRMAIGK